MSGKGVAIIGSWPQPWNTAIRKWWCYLTKQRHPSRPLRMNLSSGHNPSSAVTLCLSRVPHRYKYCKSLSMVCPGPASVLLCLPLLTSHHLSPLSFWPNATCGFLVLSNVHLGTPKCWIVVLNAFLKSRPNSSVRSKLSSLLDHSDPLQQSSALHKSKADCAGACCME